jgi:hypothetical protein
MTENTTSTSEGQDTYPNAGRDSGYVAPVGEDLVNKLSILIAGLETKLLLSNQSLSQRIENSDRARLDRNAQFQKELQERLDGHARVLDEDVKRLAASVEEAAILGGKAYTLAGEAVAGVEALAGVVSDQGERLDTIAERVTRVEVTPGTYPDLLAGMTRLEKAVKEVSRQSDRRQLYLLIAIGSIILLFLVLVALQIAAG